MKSRWLIVAVLLVGIVFIWNLWNTNSSQEPPDHAGADAPSTRESKTRFAQLSDLDPSRALASQQSSKNSEQDSDFGAQGAGALPDSEEAVQHRQTALKDLFQRWGSGEWTFQTGANGEVFRVVGGELRGIGNNEEDLQRFASEFAGVYGVTPAEVDRVELNAEGATSVVDFPQQFEKDGAEYEVYQSWMRTIIDPETGDGILVLNELKSVQREEVVVPAPIPVDEARAILSQHLGGRSFRIIEERGNLIWASSRPHQSAYEFWVDLDEDTRRIVVGAQARAVVSDESTRHF